MSFLAVSGFRNVFVNTMVLLKLSFRLIVKIKGSLNFQSTFPALEDGLVQDLRCFEQFSSIHLGIQYLIL